MNFVAAHPNNKNVTAYTKEIVIQQKRVIVSATLISEICPCPLRTLKALSNFSVRFSNIIFPIFCGYKGNKNC
jgi:hypothetical protein